MFFFFFLEGTPMSVFVKKKKSFDSLFIFWGYAEVNLRVVVFQSQIREK